MTALYNMAALIEFKTSCVVPLAMLKVKMKGLPPSTACYLHLAANRDPSWS